MKESNKKIVGGKYCVYLNEQLGKGAFATTYAAKTKSEPIVQLACKMMIKKEIQKIMNTEYVMKRVQEEAKNWKSLTHPNIVRLEGCQQTLKNIYFFMELCDEGNLQQYIEKNKFQINFQQVISFSKQIISACVYLQEQNILHRDIKPANILLKGKEIKLGDFGLARVIQQVQKSTYFTFAGTLHFMAPQILSEEKNPYPYKCDLWSVGVTLFQMCTNELPFDLHFKDNSPNKILQKIQLNEIKTDFEMFAKFPQIKQIIERMLNKEPKLRPTMKEIQQMMGELN